MSDIFLSYKSEDRLKAKIIAAALEQRGYSVWWDRIIPPGKTFDQVIEEALDAAKCVIVLWSGESVSSDWVKNEAREGTKRHILVPVLIEDVKIPFEFRHIQAAQLIEWQGAMPNPEFDLLSQSVAEIVGPLVPKKEIKKQIINELEISAKQLFEEGRYSEAIDKWKEVLNLDSENKTAMDGINNAKRHREDEENKEGERKAREERKKEERDEAKVKGKVETKAKKRAETSPNKRLFIYIVIAIIGLSLFVFLIERAQPPALTNPPLISVYPEPISFNLGRMDAGETASKTLSILNAGGGTLTWSINSDQPWININPKSGTNSSTVTVTLNTAGLSSGSHTGDITVTSNGGTKTGTISLTIEQILLVSPDPLSFDFGNVSAGASWSRTFSISNAGSGTMTWNVSTDKPWITVNPTSGTESGTITINLNTASLSSGSYTGTITVTSNGGTKSGNINLRVATKDSAVLGVGETWDIGNGWTIVAQSIDAKANPRQVWLVLYRNGIKLDDYVVAEGKTYNYKNIFSTKVASIYPGPITDMVSLTNTNYQ